MFTHTKLPCGVVPHLFQAIVVTVLSSLLPFQWSNQWNDLHCFKHFIIGGERRVIVRDPRMKGADGIPSGDVV